ILRDPMPKQQNSSSKPQKPNRKNSFGRTPLLSRGGEAATLKKCCEASVVERTGGLGQQNDASPLNCIRILRQTVLGESSPRRPQALRRSIDSQIERS